MNIPATLSTARAQLEFYLVTVVAAHLRESAFREGPIGASKPLKLWIPRDEDGKPTLEQFELDGGFLIQEFYGFTGNGVITDIEGGGLETIAYKALPVEDLLLLDNWMCKARETDRFPGELVTA